MNRVRVYACFALLVLMHGASQVFAQETIDPSAQSNFGSVSLAAGFLPDPYITTIEGGGNLDISGLGLAADCLGFATSAPDFRVQLSDGAGMLRIFYVGLGDTTLIVSDPAGQYSCNDDFDGLDPLVEFIGPADGEYNIWVGSHSAGEFIAGYLIFSELASSPSAIITTLLQPAPDSSTPAVLEKATEIRQWASAASATSQFGADGWSAQQAIGAPNTSGCGDFRAAWASASSTGQDTLTVMFDEAVVPTYVNIYQSYNPGAITGIELIPADGNAPIEVTGSADPGNVPCPGTLSIKVLSETPLINGVNIHLDQTITGSWNEIDAVELVGKRAE
jgi:hypothetical protein